MSKLETLHFLTLTLIDGFNLVRLGNLKMFAESKTERVAQEWAYELQDQCNWNPKDDYKRVINSFRQIRNTREELGSFSIFLNCLENNPRLALLISPEQHITPDELRANRIKIHEAFKSVLNHTKIIK